jgi:hypothetical protein
MKTSLEREPSDKELAVIGSPSGPMRNAAMPYSTGRRTAELMDHWGGDHGGLPIFVPSHRPPGPAAHWGYPLVT